MTNPQANWGGFEWGDAYWGAGAPAAAGGVAQSAQANALKSTVMLGLSSTPETDLSQYSTNVTVSGNGAYETSSARGAITSPRTLKVRTTIDIGTDALKMLVYHGDTSVTDYTYSMSTDLSGDLVFEQNGATILTILGSEFAAGNLDLSIQWSTRSNPDTTGASDAVISEFAVYDHTNSTWHHFPQVAHAISTTNVAWSMSCGMYWDGAAPQMAAPAQVVDWRVDGAYYNHVHMGAHWVAQRTDGAPSDVRETQEPAWPDNDSGIASQNEFTGPQLVSVAAHQREARYRALSPSINEVYGSNANSITNAYTPAKWHKKPPGASAYRWSIPFLRWVPVPKNCNFIYTRVHIHSTVSGGAAVPVGIRVYSMNRLPGGGGLGYPNQDPPAYEQYFATEILEVDHTTASGAWVVNGLVRIARNDHPSAMFKDTTHLCIAYSIDPDSTSGNDANELLTIQAWEAYPVSVVGNGGANPNGGQGMGGG